DRRQADVMVRAADGGETPLRLDFSSVTIDDSGDDLIARVGLRPWRPAIPPVVGQVLEGSAAARAGVQSGGRFVEIDGRRIDSWLGLVDTVREQAGRALPAGVERGGGRVGLAGVPDATTVDGR